MSDKDAELKIRADGSQAEAEFGKVANSAESAGKRIHDTMRNATYNMAASTKAATEQMSGSFAKVSESFGKINGMMAAFTAVIAGGAAFKAGIDESNKLTMEANKLGKALGITATEAGVLNVAIGDVYADSDTLLAANQKLTKTLGTNEMAFKHLGVATRDSSGNFRSSLDVMLDTNAALLKFKEGVDRNIEGQKIYGKQWGEVQGILKLTTERMEDARKKSEELGLVVGKENVEATASYRAAMNDVGDVLSAVKKSIGDALIPILTDLGNWFSSVGPGAVIAMKGAIGGLAAAFYGLKMAVEIVWEVIRLFVRTSVNILLTFADVASKALSFDFSGAKAAWKNGARAIADDFGEALDRITAKAKSNRDRMLGLFAKPTNTADKAGGGTTSEGGAQKDGKSQVSEWKADLEARREVEGSYFKTSLSDDEAFWNSKLTQVKKGSADEKAVRHELFAIHKAMAQQKFNEEQEALKVEMAAARQGSVERIALASESARKVGETYGWESKEYLAAMREIKKASEEFDKEQQKLAVMKVERARDHNLAMIGMERDQLALMKNIGQISDQEELAALRLLKEHEYQIEVQAQQDKIALLAEEGPAKQQQLDELAKMQDKHDAEMARMDQQRVMLVKKSWESALGAVSGAFEQSINGMIQGTQTFQKAVSNIGQAIAGEFVKMGVKKVTTWIANEAAMTAASSTGNAARAAASTAATATAVSAKAVEATAVVGANAAEAAAGGAASVAAIPVVGPGLAVGAFASLMAMVLGSKSLIKSSAGGEWRVPTDRLNIVHADETILPAHIATPLRNMVEGGGGLGGGAMQVHVHAMDSRDVVRALQDGGALHKALTGLNRNFSIPRP